MRRKTHVCWGLCGRGLPYLRPCPCAPPGQSPYDFLIIYVVLFVNCTERSTVPQKHMYTCKLNMYHDILWHIMTIDMAKGWLCHDYCITMYCFPPPKDPRISQSLLLHGEYVWTHQNMFPHKYHNICCVFLPKKKSGPLFYDIAKLGATQLRFNYGLYASLRMLTTSCNSLVFMGL